MVRRLLAVVAALACAAALSGCGSAASVPLTSAWVADTPTAIGVADGDLWPSCWARDGSLYAANGDGSGFGSRSGDIVMNRIDGTPGTAPFTGEGLAAGAEISSLWSGRPFTRKPTGILCLDGSIYLAVQDLGADFNEAPAATITRSDDDGRTWTWNTERPMFDDHVFTTIWFVDYGQNAERRPEAEYVYAFGLDGNWRDSFSDIVEDPTELFLARVPVDALQDAGRWEFYAGSSDTDEPQWIADVGQRVPVLVDERRTAYGMSVLSQGGVTYLPKRERYLYTSWTEFTFELYEAPAPWGPWTLFHTEDFGEYPWAPERIGGYATTVPSKFVSEDENTMWLQSNVCPCAPAGVTSYWWGLREMRLGDD